MKSKWVMMLVALALSGLFVYGCQRAIFRETYETFPARHAAVNTSTPAPPAKPSDAKAPAPAPSAPAVIPPPATVNTTTETGAWSRVTRVWEHIRFLAPFGVSPGESISRQKATDANLVDGTIDFKGGGGRWGFLDTIWQRMKDFLWLGVFGGVGLVALYFLVPAAQPILGAIFRAIASIFPVLGSVIERFVGKLRVQAVQVPLAQVVDGGQAFKDAVKADAAVGPDGKALLSLEAKIHVLDLFVKAHDSAQDQATQDAVAEIKA